MSTLTTTVNTSEIASLATGFLGKSAEVKAVVKQAIQQAPTVATAVIMAGEFAIEDAMTKANENRDFWHTWFYEQCYEWSDIERLGRLVKTSNLFKTKAALDRRRGKDLDVLGFCEDYPARHNAGVER